MRGRTCIAPLDLLWKGAHVFQQKALEHPYWGFRRPAIVHIALDCLQGELWL